MIERDPPEKEIMRPYPPLGILYLASYLEREGFNVGVLDNTFEKNLERYKSILSEEKPVLVGISAVEITRDTAIEMCEIAHNAGCLVVAGGPDPVNFRDLYFDGGANWICEGEGEQTLVELISQIKKQDKQPDVPGLYSKYNGEEVYSGKREMIKNLDSIPAPKYEKDMISKYLYAWKEFHGETALAVVSSRGCPRGCKWCSRSVFGRTSRRRSVSNFVDEIQHLYTNYNPDYIWIADDSFTSSIDWLQEFQEEIESRKLDLSYECLGRADEITFETARILKSTGCRLIWFGAESGSQRVLDTMNKGIDVREITGARRFMLDNHVDVGFFIMLGYPPENKRDIRLTVDLIRKTKPERVGVSVAYPISGTEFYDQVIVNSSSESWKSSGENKALFRTKYPEKFYKLARRLILKEAQVARNGRKSVVDWGKLVFYSAGLELYSFFKMD